MSKFLMGEEMSLYHLICPRESAFSLFSKIGHLDLFHFEDANPKAAQHERIFQRQLKRCDELLQQIQEIASAMDCFGYSHGLGQGNISTFFELLQMRALSKNQSNLQNIESLEKEIPSSLQDIQKNIMAAQQIRRQMNSIVEDKFCLQIAQPLLEGLAPQTFVNKIIGNIRNEDEHRFQKMIFRASKGNALTIIKPINTSGTRYQIIDPSRPHLEKFILMKLLKICNSFDAHLLDTQTNQIDEEDGKYQNKRLAISIDQQIQNKTEEYARNKEIYYLTHKHLETIFSKLQNQTEDISLLEQYRLTLEREKSIYLTLNLTRVNGVILRGLIWLPKYKEEEILYFLQNNQDQKYAQAQLHLVSQEEKRSLEVHGKILIPPTKLLSNDFLDVFQEIVNTYGIPRYREINPGFFTIITFPFLFGVMFGDIGHGIILFIYGMYLIINHALSKKTGSKMEEFRYILALMGFFSTYCGLIYNDFLSIPLEISGSCFENTSRPLNGCVPSFGIDPQWGVAKNSLQFYNSFKMKTAIIIGVLQMTLGVIIKGINAIQMKKSLDFFCEFIPQIVLLSSTFGYMGFLIIIKWAFPVASSEPSSSILAVMLNFILKSGKLPPGQYNILAGMGYTRTEQEKLQFTLVLISAACVPIMLFVKPIIIKLRTKKQPGYNDLNLEQEPNSEEQFEEQCVHQLISSIEFVLGSISHTASYLRLWALSLAHSQLSAVFFDKILKESIQSSSVFGIICNFFIFAVLSFAVLMCMDVMECFLHTLRLHWVEFQSKFYHADGILFQPFSFKNTLTECQQKYLVN